MCNAFNKKFLDEAAKVNESSDQNFLKEDTQHERFMNEAIKLAIQGVEKNEGGPFGCIIVKDGKIIGKGNNKVTSTNDPSAHAEITAIREACTHLNSYQLNGCTIYTSCEPCPMCLGAIYWARPDKVFYASNKKDAAKSGFDDDFIYQELKVELDKRTIPFKQIGRNSSLKAFKIWDEKEDKTEY
ncbi:MAG: nucleoside deaminase [Bacteroidota bacterium]